MYLLQAGGRGKVRVNLLGSGTILREVMAAAEILESDYGVPADIFSVPSFSELRREALDVERWNLLHPGPAARSSRTCASCFGDRTGPFIAATDYMKIVPDQIRQWVPGRFVVLGTDGYGRSDSRAQLRQHFEVDAQHIVLASLRALADEGKLDIATVKSAHEEVRHRSRAAEPGHAVGCHGARHHRSRPGDFKDVEVIDVLVKAGDKIDVDTPLITLETEKATMDVPSTAAGVVKSVAVKKGDRVSKGSVIVQVEGGEGESKRHRCQRAAAQRAASPPQHRSRSRPNRRHLRRSRSVGRAAGAACASTANRERQPAADRYRRSWLRERARQSFRSQVRARARRRSRRASKAPASRAASPPTTSRPSSSRR